MKTETLSLGALTLVGECRPSTVRVTVANDLGDSSIYISTTEWQSLIAVADAKRAADREIEKLKAELAKSRADEEALARKSLDDHFEYKRRRNEQFAAYDELLARLKGAEAANAAASAEIVEHTELNGHIEIAEQCRDYLAHEVTDSGDPSGKLRDFVESLSVVVGQLDRTRRQRNWYEVAHTIGRQKQIELAVNRALERARDAAQKYAKAVEALGLAADDNNPEVMATAEPIADAQAELWDSLGMLVEQRSPGDGYCPCGERLDKEHHHDV